MRLKVAAQLSLRKEKRLINSGRLSSWASRIFGSLDPPSKHQKLYGDASKIFGDARYIWGDCSNV